MAEKTLYLMRHGATEMQGRYVGSTDVPLSDSGTQQVRLTAKILREKEIAHVFCSPMKRCRQTFELLGLSCPREYDDLLREVDFGRWEKKSFQEIIKDDQNLVENWVNDPGTFSFPDGESLSDFRKRVACFKKRLITCPEEDILVVAHGGIIRYLLCCLLGLPIENYLVFHVQPGCFSSLQLYSEGGVLTGFNIAG